MEKEAQTFYSPGNKGFYLSTVHANQLPADRIEITRQQHMELLEGLSVGKVILVDVRKNLTLSEHPMPPVISAASARARRNSLLAATDGPIARHQDQTMMEATPSLSTAQLKALLTYRQELRDLPQRNGFPNIDFPKAPG